MQHGLECLKGTVVEILSDPKNKQKNRKACSINKDTFKTLTWSKMGKFNDFISLQLFNYNY